ncbi:hypothetical protein JXK06_00435 [Patescibacteria group bacterium]|nr:hypothetical protein [Patescibacteria group bacterium]
MNDLEKSEIEKEILKIIVFYDIFSFPLTIFEIKKLLTAFKNLGDLEDVLEELIKTKLQRENGFYFLRGREETVNSRNRRYNYSLRKIKIAQFFAKIFSKLPFVSALYLVNSIGIYNLRDEGDIDFFIITKAKRIWLSRFFCAGLMKILNKRPNSKTKKDKICLSFYLSEDNLNLKDLKIKEADPYFDFWEKNLLLLKDKKSLNQKFLRINNLEAYYNFSRDKDRHKILEQEKVAQGWRLMDYLEELAHSLQLKIMPRALLEAAETKDSSVGVVLSNNIIKLYLKDRRLEIKKKYEENLAKII